MSFTKENHPVNCRVISNSHVIINHYLGWDTSYQIMIQLMKYAFNDIKVHVGWGKGSVTQQSSCSALSVTCDRPLCVLLALVPLLQSASGALKYVQCLRSVLKTATSYVGERFKASLSPPHRSVGRSFASMSLNISFISVKFQAYFISHVTWWPMELREVHYLTYNTAVFINREAADPRGALSCAKVVRYLYRFCAFIFCVAVLL